jgi:hypothetical protein
MSDLSLSGEELVLQLINAANPSPPYGPFTTGSFTLSTPTALSGDLTGRNSTLTLTASPDSGYYGTQEIKYDRLDLQSVFLDLGVPQVSFQNNSYSQSTDFLGFLNSTYGLNLQEADVISEALPAADANGLVAYTLQVAEECLTFTGNLPVNITAELINLEVAFIENILNGFDPPDVTRINLITALTGNVLNGFTVADVTSVNS